MPCYDSRTSYDGKTRELERQDREIARLQRRCDELARMLCGLCNYIEAQYGLGYLIRKDPALRAWWAEHQQLDRKRRKGRHARR
jgi:hypothetical protein